MSKRKAEESQEQEETTAAKKQRTEGSFSSEETLEYWKAKCEQLQREIQSQKYSRCTFVQEYTERIENEDSYIDEDELAQVLKSCFQQIGQTEENFAEVTNFQLLCKLVNLFHALEKYVSEQSGQISSMLESEEEAATHLQFLVNVLKAQQVVSDLDGGFFFRHFYHIASGDVQLVGGADDNDEDEEDDDDDEAEYKKRKGKKQEAPEMDEEQQQLHGLFVRNLQVRQTPYSKFNGIFKDSIKKQGKAITKACLKVPASINIDSVLLELVPMVFLQKRYMLSDEHLQSDAKDLIKKLSKTRPAVSLQLVKNIEWLQGTYITAIQQSGNYKESLEQIKEFVVTHKSAVNYFSDEIIKALKKLYIAGHPEYYHILVDTFKWISKKVDVTDAPFFFDYLVNNKTKTRVPHFKEYFRFAFKMLATNLSTRFKVVYSGGGSKTTKEARLDMILKMLQTLTKNFSEADIESAILKTEMHKFCQLILETLSFDLVYNTGKFCLDKDSESYDEIRLKILRIVDRITPHIVPYICKFLLVCREAYRTSNLTLHEMVQPFVDQTGIYVKDYTPIQKAAPGQEATLASEEEEMKPWYKLVVHRYIPKSNSQLFSSMVSRNFVDLRIHITTVTTSSSSAEETSVSTTKRKKKKESLEDFIQQKAHEFKM